MFLGSWIPDFYYHRIRNSNYPFLGIGPRFRPFEVDPAPIVPSFLGVVLRPSFAPVFDRHFHGSFSVGDRPGNCLFHWVFWELAPFFEDS